MNKAIAETEKENTMHPTRMIFDDAPAFIPVPTEYRHHRIEVTLWPLETEPSSSDGMKVPVTGTDSTLEHTRGLEAAQQDVMTRMWDNDSDEIWNHVESL